MSENVEAHFYMKEDLHLYVGHEYMQSKYGKSVRSIFSKCTILEWFEEVHERIVIFGMI